MFDFNLQAREGSSSYLKLSVTIIQNIRHQETSRQGKHILASLKMVILCNHGSQQMEGCLVLVNTADPRDKHLRKMQKKRKKLRPQDCLPPPHTHTHTSHNVRNYTNNITRLQEVNLFHLHTRMYPRSGLEDVARFFLQVVLGFFSFFFFKK